MPRKPQAGRGGRITHGGAQILQHQTMGSQADFCVMAGHGPVLEDDVAVGRRADSDRRQAEAGLQPGVRTVDD